jgi:hypothetical protein
MDNSNLREEQLRKLAEAVQLIDVSTNYLTMDQIKARGILNEARNCIIAVLSGERGESGPSI